MTFPRASGILLHPTSLPGRFGVGDLGPSAYRFIDFLAQSRQTLWQVLPLGPTGYGDSPYQCFSAFAGNTLLVSPERLAQDGLLSAREILEPPDLPPGKVDFGSAIEFKNLVLSQAYSNFKSSSLDNWRVALEEFSAQESGWLEDYALFRAIKNARRGAEWISWEPALVHREKRALAAARKELYDEIEAQKFYQFLFFKQWNDLNSYAHDRDVKIVGDIPIFVARDSADVWTNPGLFKLHQNGAPVVVAGVPPDYFSATGQLWGNPLYNWDGMRAEGFRWWIDRVRSSLSVFDILRIDHFRGFAASWEIPAGEPTAVKGRWVTAPGRELFSAIENELGSLPIIAEDLGVITPDVEELRDHFGFPGMRILQFAFGGDAKSIDLPHNYIKNVVVYTGTHDNDTTVGWFSSGAGKGSTRDSEQIARERKYCMEYLNSDGREIHWDFIRAVLSSVANTAIVPLQDVLGLGHVARMNLPASTSGNWAWRLSHESLLDQAIGRLGNLTTIYGREQPRDASA